MTRQGIRGLLGATLTLALVVIAVPFGASIAAEESSFLSGVRRLTFEGRRAGEGYFAPDGSAMVFQSEREAGNPFFQIYLLDLRTGQTERISSGVGKTTCAFFRPGTQEVLFSSTHHDPASEVLQQRELERRQAGEERRYSWDYDPEMELYARNTETGALSRLTNERGYDAEASYSPDGEWIVWSSNREAYAGELSVEEQRRLEADPAYFADLYRMRADGSQVEQISRAPGYDGGPFYFADGSRVVWRRFDEAGLLADLYTALPDGSDVRRITEFGSMSWAPYPHPSGRYLVFASNKLGFENFELFLVDAEGRKQPVQVTHSPGFDGLPVFSPDGKRLSFTSSRHGGSQGQIYLADWSHEGALEALEAAPTRASAAP